MASAFFQPAFAALTRWWAPDHIRALTTVTLAGGLASTICAPLAALLAGHLTWRNTYLALAGNLALITIPAHALALRAAWPQAPRGGWGTVGDAATVARSRPFWMLATAFTLTSLAMNTHQGSRPSVASPRPPRPAGPRPASPREPQAAGGVSPASGLPSCG